MLFILIKKFNLLPIIQPDFDVIIDFIGKWCQRRDWPPPLDARAASAAEAAKRGLLYQSVFLGGSPNDYNSCKYIFIVIFNYLFM